jgi:hypothetical protein
MKVKLLSPVTHNGSECKKGDIIDISEAEARRLVKLGFVKGGNDKAQGADTPAGGKSKKGSKPPAKNPPAHESAGEDPNDPDDDDLDADTFSDIDKMTDDEIAQELTMHGVGYKSGATRDELAALLRDWQSKQG